MKPLVLALATALVGTGCYQPPVCTTRNIQVDWSHGFDGPSAVTGQPCGTAGVSFIDIFVNNQQVIGPLGNGHFACGDLAEIIGGVTDGATQVTTEGLAVDGSTILYRDVQSFTASGCNDFLVATAPAAGSVDLSYAFQSGSTCASATSYMWFTIFDVAANIIDPSSVGATSSNPRQFPCGPTPPVLSLPVGSYNLTGMTEEVESPATVFTQAAYLCRAPVGFTVASQAQTIVSPVLADTGGAACQ
jgi:hypothetical protein